MSFIQSIPTLHDLPAAERPRERMQSHGVQSLSSSELLAIILGMGTAGKPVMMTSQLILRHFGDLRSLGATSLEELRSIDGLGPAKACRLLACLEFARRVHQEERLAGETQASADNPSRLAELLRNGFAIRDQEHYWVISLSSRNHVIAIDAVSVGIIDAALVHPRETFAMAIRRRAAKIIVCHNHPSGDCQPSEDDRLITKRLQTAGKIVGIPVMDHLIVSQNTYFSFYEQGLMGAKG